MDFQFTKYEINNNCATIILNREDKLNSFNREMSKELIYALDLSGNNDNIRAIILTGAGKAFCAGQDLAEAISGKYDIDNILSEQYNPIIKMIRNITKPIIAAVNGTAAGAGANIALACDIVIASDKASFIQAFSKIGLIPDSGGTYTLPRLIGLAKATALMMTGEKISALEAEKMNMIYKAVPNEEFNEYINTIATNLSNMPTKALGLIKRALNHTYTNSLQAQLELERVLQKEAAESYDYKEGVDSFLEKRAPIFKGK
ncbi:MAG TPA: enoyl-CoA hydratase-related protein [Candidatus Kapabacteria bacterium]|nr:enoyl-CoA hydratase-related protein [Candidatus Kapabacteria bacterium]